MGVVGLPPQGTGCGMTQDEPPCALLRRTLAVMPAREFFLRSSCSGSGC